MIQEGGLRLRMSTLFFTMTVNFTKHSTDESESLERGHHRLLTKAELEWG